RRAPRLHRAVVSRRRRRGAVAARSQREQQVQPAALHGRPPGAGRGDADLGRTAGRARPRRPQRPFALPWPPGCGEAGAHRVGESGALAAVARRQRRRRPPPRALCARPRSPGGVAGAPALRRPAPPRRARAPAGGAGAAVAARRTHDPARRRGRRPLRPHGRRSPQQRRPRRAVEPRRSRRRRRGSRPRRFRARDGGACVTPFLALVRRDLQLALRQGSDAALVLIFYLLAVLLFPFGVGPEPNLLARISTGVLWVTALLAALLAIERLFVSEYEDGSLDQLALLPLPLPLVVL